MLKDLLVFQKAYDLDPQPILLYNIARMQQKKGDLTRARSLYERYLMDETDAAGLERGRPGRAVGLIARELTRLCRTPLGAAELRRAVEYAVGQLRLGLESTTPQMNWIGEQAMAGLPRTLPEEEIAALQAVTAAEVRALAQTVFTPARLSLAVVAQEITPAEERNFRQALDTLG